MSMERSIQHAINSLTLKRINSEAYDTVAKSFEECFEYIKKKGFKTDPYFKQHYAEVSKRPGLLDAWMLLTQLTTFAAGVAAGRSRKKIQSKDMITTKLWDCDSWPGCGPMRIEGSLESLSILMKWYDTHYRERAK